VPTSLLPIGPPPALVASAPSPGADSAPPPSLMPPAQPNGADTVIPAVSAAGGPEHAHALAHVAPAAPQRVSVPVVQTWPRAQLIPLSPGHRLFKGTFDDETVDLLLRAEALLSHTLPSSDHVEVLKRVLRDWVQAAERRRYGLTEQPRARRSTGNGRYIPAEVKRAVHERDGGRCTFVGEDNRRCGKRKLLQFDHVTPVAKGGKTTEDNLRLRCRRHNQLEAERAFGEGFMERKRERHAAATFVQAPGSPIQDAPARVAPA
jgi:5-methylcytosine-specific restriction endonuclease McrA